MRNNINNDLRYNSVANARFVAEAISSALGLGQLPLRIDPSILGRESINNLKFLTNASAATIADLASRFFGLP